MARKRLQCYLIIYVSNNDGKGILIYYRFHCLANDSCGPIFFLNVDTRPISLFNFFFNYIFNSRYNGRALKGDLGLHHPFAWFNAHI